MGPLALEDRDVHELRHELLRDVHLLHEQIFKDSVEDNTRVPARVSDPSPRAAGTASTPKGLSVQAGGCSGAQERMCEPYAQARLSVMGKVVATWASDPRLKSHESTGSERSRSAQSPLGHEATQEQKRRGMKVKVWHVESEDVTCDYESYQLSL